MTVPGVGPIIASAMVAVGSGVVTLSRFPWVMIMKTTPIVEVVSVSTTSAGAGAAIY
jgi:hypothetical protein